jgi:hypothetical protein
MSKENQRLKRQAEDLRTQHLADSAKIKRQNELLVQHRNTATQKEKSYHREISELYHQLNSVQMVQCDLSDDQILGRMRKLEQNLDCWVNSNFKGTDRLSSLGRDGEFPSSIPQRRAVIQARVTEVLFSILFSHQWLGLYSHPWGSFINHIEHGVEQSCKI